MAPGGRLASRPSTQSSQQRHAQLPPYQPPSCPLTNQHKLQLSNLAAEGDYAKYKKHLSTCVSTLINATADSNEALKIAKEDLEDKKTKRRQREARQAETDEAEDEDGNAAGVGKSQEEITLEEHVEKMTEKVERLSREAEKAMRELIDYTDELRAQDQLMQGVIAKASQPAPARRRQGSDEDGDEDMPDAADDEEVVGPTEILKMAREDYNRAYGNRSMGNRYARNKDYATFKEMVHEAVGDTEPLPPPAEWFGPDGQPRDRRSMNANANYTDEEEDEDFVITGEVADLRCPLTLQVFKEPMKNNKCKHVFEKSAIMEMFERAPVFRDGGRRGPGVKKLQCPQAGCDHMLEEKDLSEDIIMKRIVKRQKAQEAREAERAQEGGYESEEDVQGRSQRNNRRETVDVDAAVRIKRELAANMESRSDE